VERNCDVDSRNPLRLSLGLLRSKDDVMTDQPDWTQDFDAFVMQHDIQPEELGQAFAAWLGTKGWDSTYEEIL